MPPTAASLRPPRQPAPAALRSLRPLVGYLRRLGHEPSALLNDLGVDPLRILDPIARIPYRVLVEAWQRAERLTRDPELGLHVAQQIDLRPMASLDHETDWIVVQLFVVSATVHEGLARFASYFPVGFGGSQIVLDRDAETLRIRHVVSTPTTIPRALSQFILGLLAGLLHDFPMRPVLPLAVRFAHPAPPQQAAHHGAFRIAPQFAAGEDALLIRAADLDVPLPSARPDLAASLERIGAQTLAAVAPVDPIVAQVEALLLAELESGNPSAERMADLLHISVRTLARRLSQSGTSHRALLDDVRSRLAHRYVVEERQPLAEVAQRLGFSEVRALHRAFRRWYGTSPTDYRDAAGRRLG